MTIDSIRLLADSAGPLWERLSAVAAIDGLLTSESFDDWFANSAGQVDPNRMELHLIRRDYYRLRNLLNDLECLVQSRPAALDLVRSYATQHDRARS